MRKRNEMAKKQISKPASSQSGDAFRKERVHFAGLEFMEYMGSTSYHYVSNR